MEINEEVKYSGKIIKKDENLCLVKSLKLSWAERTVRGQLVDKSVMELLPNRKVRRAWGDLMEEWNRPGRGMKQWSTSNLGRIAHIDEKYSGKEWGNKRKIISKESYTFGNAVQWAGLSFFDDDLLI